MKSRPYRFSWDFIGDVEDGRLNLGNSTRIEVYRLFQYTLRDVLEARYGTEESDRILYEAGYLAGKNFGAVLVKTNVLLVLPNKLAELGAVYDCLH